VQQDGKIIVGGSSYALFNCWDYYGGIYCDEAFGMARLNSNGIIDSSFGINGRVRDSIALRSASSMALQADGKILVTGYG
ncbi:delta-60 repeat domain-containing protein, partial [Salmonella sp. SAL4435]|uniref:delta-60 repeat domain-containing protein n=1 Tax=Salmonella sp. SAL4435 TaxID=3159890 RepID=UPI00397939A4